MPNISVVIPNYNGERFIDECLGALFKQSFTDFETVFVDNGSADNSIQRIKADYPGVVLVEMGENTGFAKACNVGVQHSKGEFIALLNTDAMVDELWLEKLYGAILRDERIFSVSSRMVQYYNREAIDDAGDGYTLLGNAFQRGNCRKVKRYLKDARVFSACGGASIYRKSIYESLGGLDERFFAYLEDIDLGFRSRLNGYYTTYCAAAIAYHVGSATSKEISSSFKLRLSARNNQLVIAKNMPPWMRAVGKPFLALGRRSKRKSYALHKQVDTLYEGWKEAEALLSDIVPSYTGTTFRNQWATWMSLWASTFRLLHYKVLRKLLRLGRAIIGKGENKD